MAAVQQQVDKQALKSLVPLNGLSRPHFEELVSKSGTKDIVAGRYLFREGERDGNTYFLLSGEIALMHGREVKETLKAGSEAARHPIAHQQPRQLSAKAQGRSTVLVVDSGLLDVMLAWDQSNSYEVTEIQSEDDEDWMTRMLQSELFQRLPANNIQQVLMRVEEQAVAAGTTVVSQDEEGDYYYMIKQGRAKVTRRPNENSKPIKVAELRDGDSFGEEALLSGARRNANVTMLTDGVLMRLSKTDFDALLREPLIHQLDFTRASAVVAEGAAWLDVRLPGEYQNAHLPDSVNVPLAAVRDRIGELQQGRAYVVCCDTGTRSSGAAFLLNQRGLDTYVLEGGLNSVPRDALSRGPGEEQETSAEVIALRDVSPGALARGEAELARARAKAAAFLKQARQQADEVRAKLRAAQQQIAEKQTEAAKLDRALQDKQQELRELHRSFERAEAMGEEVEQLREGMDKVRKQAAAQRQDLEQARHAAAEREQELTVLREQVQELEQSHSELAAELSAARAEAGARAEQAGELDAVRRELAEAQETVKRLQQERDQGVRAQQRLDALQDENTALEERLRAETDGAEDERRALGEQLQSQSAELDSLRRRIADHAQSESTAAARVQELEQQLAQSRQGGESLQTDVREAQRRTEELEQQLVAAQQAGASVKTELADAQSRADELSRRVQSLESQRGADLGQLQGRLDESEAACTALRQEIEHGRGEAERRLAEVQAQADARRAELKGAQDATAAAAQERDSLRDELDRVRETLRQRDLDLERAQGDRSRLGELEQQLAIQRQQAEEERDQQSSEIERLRAALAEQAADAERRIRAGEERHATLEQERDRERSAREEQERSLAELQAERERLRSEHEAALAGERTRLEQVREQLSGTEAELDRRRRAAEEARAQVEILQRELDTDERQVDERIAALREERDAVRQELGDACGRGDEAERQYQQERQRLEEVESARSELAARLAQVDAEHQHALEEAHIQRSALEARLQDLERAVAEQQEVAHKESEAAGSLRLELEALRTEVEAQRQGREQAETQRSALSDKLQELEVAAVEHEEAARREADAATDLNQQLDTLRAEVERQGRGRDEAEARNRELETSTAALQDQLGRSQDEIEQLRAQLAGIGGEEVRTEVASIRELADQELRQAAEELKRLKHELEASQQRVRKLDAELALARQLGGESGGGADVQQLQRTMDEQLARYKTEAEAMLAQVRDENAQLHQEVRRLGEFAGSVGEGPADPGAVDRALRVADRNDRLFALPTVRSRRYGLAAGIVMGLVAAAIAAWWYLQQPRTAPESQSIGAVPEHDSAAPPDRATPVRPPPAMPAETAEVKPQARRSEPPSAETAEPQARRSQQMPATPAPQSYRDALADGGLGPVMVPLPQGQFTMGSPRSSPYFDERPPRAVQVRRFSIGKYEVTFEEFDRFAESTGRPFPDDDGRGRARHPAVNVTWDDAVSYAEWLSEQTGRRYRLPTEAEWEYAARAGTATFHWWGNGPAEGRANCFDCGSQWDGRQAAAVGALASNALGLHDTAGNVMEWVRDCYRETYAGAPRDAAAVDSGDCTARIARGGSYRSVQDNVRSAKRAPFAPQTRSDELGFRLARE